MEVGAQGTGHSPRPGSSCGSPQPVLKPRQQEQLQTQRQAGRSRGGSSTPIAKVAGAAGSGKAVSEAHVTDGLLLVATASGVHTAFVDDRPPTLRYSAAYEAVLLVPTADGCAWALSRVSQLTEDTILDACRT